MSAPVQHYSVLVRCFTYNQEKYIEDALNGFVMQQTNFPFVCLIVDDASTDKEPEVIKSFLQRECDMENVEFKEIEEAHIISVHHKKNSNCLMVVYLLKNNLYTQKEKKMALVKPWRDACKYEAMCEGDDYWTDPLKLQKQVDFLEKNTDYGLVYTNYKKNIQENQSFIEGQSKQSDFDSLLFSNNICTLTTLYRKGIAEEYRSKYQKISISHSWKMGDYPLWLYIAAHSKIKYLEDVTGVYRVLSNSASHSQDYKKSLSFLLSSYDIRFYFAKEYQKDYHIKNIAGNEVKAIINISNKFNKNAKINVTKFFLRHQLWHPRFYLLCLLSKYKKSRKFAKMLKPNFFEN